ncbi:unnamed protein product, partial [Cyprideis torosa]
GPQYVATAGRPRQPFVALSVENEVASSSQERLPLGARGRGPQYVVINRNRHALSDSEERTTSKAPAVTFQYVTLNRDRSSASTEPATVVITAEAAPMESATTTPGLRYVEIRRERPLENILEHYAEDADEDLQKKHENSEPTTSPRPVFIRPLTRRPTRPPRTSPPSPPSTLAPPVESTSAKVRIRPFRRPLPSRYSMEDTSKGKENITVSVSVSVETHPLSQPSPVRHPVHSRGRVTSRTRRPFVPRERKSFSSSTARPSLRPSRWRGTQAPARPTDPPLPPTSTSNARRQAIHRLFGRARETPAPTQPPAPTESPASPESPAPTESPASTQPPTGSQAPSLIQDSLTPMTIFSETPAPQPGPSRPSAPVVLPILDNLQLLPPRATTPGHLENRQHVEPTEDSAESPVDHRGRTADVSPLDEFFRFPTVTTQPSRRPPPQIRDNTVSSFSKNTRVRSPESARPSLPPSGADRGLAVRRRGRPARPVTATRRASPARELFGGSSPADQQSLSSDPRGSRERQMGFQDGLVRTQAATSQPSTNPVELDYDDYYEGDLAPEAGTGNKFLEYYDNILHLNIDKKLETLPDGRLRCLEPGLWPHPRHCKKFVSCVRMEDNSLRGWIYSCPSHLAFDPVGGMCTWNDETLCG